jgi:cytochrome c peroxidase
VARPGRVAFVVLLCSLTGGGCAPSDGESDTPASGELASPKRDRWSPAEVQLLQSLSIASLPALEPAPSNRVATDPRAARLGHRLFFEPRLSANGEISCMTCHRPGRDFADDEAKSSGLGQTSRNAPTLIGAAYSPWQYWDGRRDSLWAQALAPLEARAEMGSTRLEVVRFVTTDPEYREAYADLFGPAPDFTDASRFPASASPYGDKEARAAWSRLPAEARQQVNRAFSNVGKAIAAYERLLVPGASHFDRYVEQLLDGEEDPAALSPDAIAGLRLFIDPARSQCLRCHNGPLLTNHAFHDIATNRFSRIPDLGRFVGVQSLLLDEFNCLGPYSDAPESACRELKFLNRREIGEKAGAFKTPTLRGVGRTAPYLHDGGQ